MPTRGRGLGELMAEARDNWLRSNDQITPEILVAETDRLFSAEMDSLRDSEWEHHKRRRAGDVLRLSVETLDSPQLQLILPGIEIPRLVPVETPDGRVMKPIAKAYDPETTAWNAECRRLAVLDVRKCDRREELFTLARRHGYSATVTLGDALKKVGIVL